MVRCLTALLVALAIAFLVPQVGAGRGAPAGLAALAAADCACPGADQDCPDHGKSTCGGALACMAQCGATLPMLAGDINSHAVAAISSLALISQDMPLVSATSAPPIRPPTASIPA